MQGEDLVNQGTLRGLVQKELEKLAASDNIPSGLQSDECRNWFRHSDNVGPFIEVLIARAGDRPELSQRAEERLASEYERITGETRKLAAGPIALTVSHVYGQLTATTAGKQALQLAFAQNSVHLTPDSHQFPSDADLDRVRAMAATLLEAGKRSWKMPRFVAPLTLTAHEKQSGQEPRPTTATELSAVIKTGGHLILFGEGGIGKTTFLLDLSTTCIKDGHRIPLYVDAAVWAKTNVSLFEYLASRPSAQGNGVTSAELTTLAKAGHLVIMLNGSYGGGFGLVPALTGRGCGPGL